MVDVPEVFNQPDAVGFTFMRPGVKFPPFEEGWQKPDKAHSYQEAKAHKGNIGVLAGNGYIGLDQDDPEAFQGLELPNTTMWETRPGRLGMRFKSSDRTEALTGISKKLDLSQLKLFDGRRIVYGWHPPIGEIKLERTYQIIPPSWKTLDDGTRVDYKMLDSSPPAEISLVWLLSELLRHGIVFSKKPETKKSKIESDVAIPEDAANANPSTKVMHTGRDDRSYAEAALQDECRILASTPKGDRNNQLNKSAFALGQLVAANALDEAEAVRELTRAGGVAGLKADAIEKTIKSGLEAGAKHPREIPGRPRNDGIKKPTLEEALLFLASRHECRKVEDDQGFDAEDIIFGSAMAGKVRAGQRLTKQEYKDVYKMLKNYNNKQLIPAGMDLRLIPKEQPEDNEEPPSNRPEVEEIPEDIERIAMRIAERGKPLKFMLRTFAQTHNGDKVHAESQFISFGQQSAVNTKGNFDNWEGPSGKGKSDAVKACVRQLPGEYAITSSITSKSLYHRAKGGGVLPGSVLHLDDKNVPAGSDLEETLKRAQTFFQDGAEHETVDGKGNYQRVKLPPRLLVIRTCVTSSDSDAQLKNRSVSHGVDSSRDTDKEVCDLVLKLGEDGQTTDMTTRQIMICKALWRDIKSELYRVVTPASRKLIEFSDVSNRRNPSLFLDMVKGITCIRHKQRISEDGPSGEKILYANYEDYKEAAKLFNSQGDYLGTRLDKSEFEAVQHIKDQGSEGATINGIFYYLAEKFPNDGWNTQKVRRLMDGRPERGDQGLADTVPGIEPRLKVNDNGSKTKFYVIPGEISLGVRVTIHDPRTKNVSIEDLSHLSHRSPTLGKEQIDSTISPIPTSYPKYPNKEKDREEKERDIESTVEPTVCSEIYGVDFGKTGKRGQPNEPTDCEKAVFPERETVGIGGKTGGGPHPRQSEPTPTTNEKVRIVAKDGYRTQINVSPGKWVDHLYNTGEIAEFERQRAQYLIKRGVAEAT